MRAPGPGGGTLEILPLFVLRDEGGAAFSCCTGPIQDSGGCVEVMTFDLRQRRCHTEQTFVHLTAGGY